MLYAYPGGLTHSLHREGIKYTSVQSEVFEKVGEKSDEVIVVMKYVKAYGAKDRNTNTFPNSRYAEY